MHTNIILYTFPFLGIILFFGVPFFAAAVSGVPVLDDDANDGVPFFEDDADDGVSFFEDDADDGVTFFEDDADDGVPVLDVTDCTFVLLSSFSYVLSMTTVTQ